MRKRFACLVLAVLLLPALFGVPALATGNDYDPDHPENLSDMDIDALAAILIEADTGMVVYEKNADARLYPASTTKILTTYLGLLLGDMEETVTTTETALQVEEGSSKIPLSLGEEIVFRDLLYATMVRSGNEGANLIAETIGGSIEGFVTLMNSYVDSLGLVNTHFANPNGLHDGNHYTSARDLAIIIREAMQDETFRDIARTTSYDLPQTNINRSRNLSSRMAEFFGNPESSTYYPYAIGIKTGYTSAAGHCYVAAAEKDGITFISVVLHCSGDASNYRYCWRDTRRLMEYGFSQYVNVSVSELYAMQPKVLEVSKYALDDPLLGQLELSLNKLDSGSNDSIITLRSRLDYLVANFNDLVNIEYVHEPVAPISAGDVIATLTYYPETGEPIEYELLASRSIAKRMLDVPDLDDIIRDTENDPNPLPRLSVEIIAFFAAMIALIWMSVKGFKRLLGFRSKKTRHKPIKPMSRYYR
ncbi:MAG: D-alanyl-D-alanine carboxypeptidase [Clostridia bacterium]|nr:D-alanyl-D-alanine carboxypeptidase [Clostridia bacterium]